MGPNNLNPELLLFLENPQPSSKTLSFLLKLVRKAHFVNNQLRLLSPNSWLQYSQHLDFVPMHQVFNERRKASAPCPLTFHVNTVIIKTRDGKEEQQTTRPKAIVF